MIKDSKPPNDREVLDRILKLVEQYLKHPREKASTKIYDNKAIMQLLNIKDKYLKKLRDNGYLGYSREGDKYWYTQADVDRFMQRFHYHDFAPDRYGGLPIP